jgi:hypothetical protein
VIPAYAYRGALLLPLLLTGCLVPFPIEERPAAVNYPPFYINESVSPSAARVRDYDPRADGDAVVLRVGVVGDPNATDSLFARLFINFDPNESNGLFGNATLRPGQTGPLEFNVDPCRHRRGLSGETTIAVDLIVSDRPFNADAVNNAVPDDAGTFTISWQIRFDEETCD